jgi:hypothetical protein
VLDTAAIGDLETREALIAPQYTPSGDDANWDTAKLEEVLKQIHEAANWSLATKDV